MSVHRSTQEQQQQQGNVADSSSPSVAISPSSKDGQSSLDFPSVSSALRNDLNMDYIASIFASNGTIPPTIMNQNPALSVVDHIGLNQNHMDLMNSLMVGTCSSNAMDHFTASALLSSLLYSQQHLNDSKTPTRARPSRQQSSSPATLYSPQAIPNLDSVLLLQQALMQHTGINDHDLLNQHHQHYYHHQQQQQQQQQQQMALAIAALLGQSEVHLNNPHQQPQVDLQPARDFRSYGGDFSDETTSGAVESFSSVLAKLIQGLNQGANVTASSSNSNRISSTLQSLTKESQNSPPTSLNPPQSTPHPSVLIPSHQSTSIMSELGSRFSAPDVESSVEGVPTSRFTTTIQRQNRQRHHQKQLQQQMDAFNLAKVPPTCFGSHQSPCAVQISQEGQLQRIRRRSKVCMDKLPRAATSTPLSETAISDSSVCLMTPSSSIDGTITDVLKRLSGSSDQMGTRKRRHVDVERNQTNSTLSNSAVPCVTAATTAATANTSTTTTTTTATIISHGTKSETQTSKRARGLGAYVDSAYRTPLTLGWRRETLIKGVGPGGLLGDVVYTAPCGRQLWNVESVREYLRSTGTSFLSTDDFSFKSYVRLGDFYECNRDSKGFVKMSDTSIDSLISMSQETPPLRATSSSSSSTTGNQRTSRATVGVSNSSTKSTANHPSLSDMQPNEEILKTESYTKTFSDFSLGLPHFLSLQSHGSTPPSNQIPPLWSPWSRTIENPSAPTSTSPPTEFPFHYPSVLQKDQFSSKQSNLTNFEDFVRLQAFFTKHVDDQRRLETEKETQRKANQEAQTAKAREQRIDFLVKEELRHPVEDLRLLDSKKLPALDRIDGNRMPGQMFSDCIFVLEFLHGFTEVLCIDPETIPTMSCMQAAFVDRNEACIDVINHLTIELLKFAILDPGIPTPRLVTQLLGQRFSELEVNTDTITGLLRVFLIGRNGYEDEMSDWLAPSNVNHLTDLSGPRFAGLLAFICDELVCSSRLISNEVDRTIEMQASLRRDKFNLEAKIRKIRVILARKFGLDHAANQTQTSANPEIQSQQLNKQKWPAFLQSMRQPALVNYDSSDEEDLNSAEELERRIESFTDMLEMKQNAIEECAFRLSGVFLGQDRFYRNYFVLGSVGGIFVEGQSKHRKEGYVIQESPDIFDADAIVREIMARKELSIARHFNINITNTGNGTKTINPLRHLPTSIIAVESVGMEICEGVSESEETLKLKREQGGLTEFPLTQLEHNNGDENSRQSPILKVGKIDEAEEEEEEGLVVSKTEGIYPSISNGAELEADVCERKSPEVEELTPLMPLDLSTTRVFSPTSTTSQGSDATIWQSLTEQDLTEALESYQLNDTFLTTATLLFTTQTGILDRSAIAGPWTDPSWHVILIFYKLQLLRSVAFEKKCKRDNESNALSVALKQLKSWLDEGNVDGSVVKVWDPLSINGDHLDDEDLQSDVDEILKETGVQTSEQDNLQSVPDEYKDEWWRICGSSQLESLIEVLSTRGIRERLLAQSIQHSEEAVTSSVNMDASTVLDLDSTVSTTQSVWKPQLLKVWSRRGKGRGTNATNLGSPTSVSTLIGQFGGGGSGCIGGVVTGGRLTPLQFSHSKTNHFDSNGSNPTLDSFTYRGEFDKLMALSPGGADKSIFIGENFERAMKLDQKVLDHPLSDGDRAFLEECRFLELTEGLVDRVLSASLQAKAWQAPMKAMEDDSIQILPRGAPKVHRYDYWPLDLARERLLQLEAHIERRYLLPPLSCESRLDVIPVTYEPSADVEDSVCSDSTHEGSSETSALPHIRRVAGKRSGGNDDDTSLELSFRRGPSQGLLEWRRTTRKSDTIADLKRCAMQFEAAIAWDKSIMKVLCQICRRDKNEARLLLCDGCDHGYHTYCFRPPMISIPDGDWFCYNCVSKATNTCHCFVCGLSKPMGSSTGKKDSGPPVEPAHRLVQCAVCSRGAHPACLRPPLNRLPKRWNCLFCLANGNVQSERPSDAHDKPDLPKKIQTTKFLLHRSQQVHSKRCYTKSGTHQASRIAHRPKSLDQIKQKKKERGKVGRPKGGGQKRSSNLKRRGRPPGFYKLSFSGRSKSGGNESGSDAGGGEDEQEEVFAEEKDLEASRSEYEDDLSMKPSSGFNGLSSTRKVAILPTNERHRMGKFRKSLGFAERDFCRNSYGSVSEWRDDIRLIFTNCQTFNEDDSAIGQAGHGLRSYFESKWADASHLSNTIDTPSPREASCGDRSVSSAQNSPTCDLDQIPYNTNSGTRIPETPNAGSSPNRLYGTDKGEEAVDAQMGVPLAEDTNTSTP